MLKLYSLFFYYQILKYITANRNVQGDNLKLGNYKGAHSIISELASSTSEDLC
jgi:hypothetical protein